MVVEDADGDHVHCRWAESYLNECGGVCRDLPTEKMYKMYVLANSTYYHGNSSLYNAI